jgi:hypothetical protein
MLRRYRRPRRIALVAGIALVSTLAALIVVGPMLVDTPAVRAQIQHKASEALSGQIAWDSMRVRLLPWPRAVMRGVRASLPGRVQLKMEQADVHLRLMPLLRGRAQITSISLTRPAIELEIPAAKSAQDFAPADPIAAYRAAMHPLVERVRNIAPKSVITIDAATVDVRASGMPSIQLRDLSVRARTAPAGADVEVTSASNFWGRLDLVAHVEFADLSGHADLNAVDIKPQPWLDRALAGRSLAASLPAANLRVQVRTDARTSIQCTAAFDAPSIQIDRQKRPLQIGRFKVTATALVRKQDMEVEATELRLGSLFPSGRASLKMALDGQHPQLAIDTPWLELAALREATLALAGDDRRTAEYAARIRGGELADVHVKMQADSWAELFAMRHIEAALTLTHGSVLVPGIEQQATGVSAHAKLADGAIELTSAGGQLGGSHLTDATLHYALGDHVASADVGFDLQLAEALRWTRSASSQAQGAKLGDVVSATGRLKGRAHFASAHRNWSATVAIAGSDASVRLQQLPWPIAVHAFRASASSEQLGVTGWRGSIGRSSVDDAAVQIALGSNASLVSASGRAMLALDELYPWVRSQPALADALRDLTAVSGTARVALHRLSGPIHRPAELQYDMTIEPQQSAVVHARLPAQASVTGGSIRLDASTVKLDRVGIALLDARAAVSGTISDYRTQRSQMSISLADGSVGATAMQWIWQRAGAPARLELRTPLRFSAPRLLWGPGRKLDVQGNLKFGGGQNVALELGWNPLALDVRQVKITDRLSGATLALLVRDRLLHAGFSGTLNGRSITAMLKHGGDQTGVVDGDLGVTLDLDRTGRSTAHGHLGARAADLTWLLDKPVQLERLDVDADGSTLHIRDAVVKWAQQIARVSGDVKQGERGVIIDAQLDSLGIVVDELLPQADETGAAEPAARKEEVFGQLWPLFVTGLVKVRSDFIQYGQYRAAPVSATVTLEEQRAQIDVHEARLCGISFPLTVEAMPHRLAASAHIIARRQELEESVRCLTDQRVLITGGFDLRADLSTSGRRGELARNLKGTVTAQAREGQIRKFALLGNILALTSVTGLFEQGAPQLGRQGFAYRQLAIAGHFDGGRFVLEEGALDSNAFGLAATGTIDFLQRDSRLTVLVAPFSRVDRLVRKVPIVGYVVGGTFTSVPVGVSGDIRNPVVTPLGPRAVTSELTGIFERTLKLPARLLAPLGRPKEKGSPAKP